MARYRDLFTSMADFRKDGPGTSRQAAVEHEESGSAATQRKRIWFAVRERPGLTAGEYADWLEVERAVVSRRLPELRALGFVEKGVVRPCNVTHKKCATWVLKREEQT